MKACSVCRLEKEDNAFNKRASTKSGRRSECRPCQSLASKAKKAKNPQAHNEATAERKRKWRLANPDAGKKHYAKNRDKEAARHRKRLEQPGAREAVRARSRAWHAANKERHNKSIRAWSDAHREQLREYFKQHYQANRAKYFEKSRRRRALQLNRQVEPFTVKQLNARMSVFGHCCAYCSGPFEEVDHVIPLARGGMHCLANLRPACRSCNRRKSAKPLSAWLSEVS